MYRDLFSYYLAQGGDNSRETSFGDRNWDVVRAHSERACIPSQPHRRHPPSSREWASSPPRV